MCVRPPPGPPRWAPWLRYGGGALAPPPPFGEKNKNKSSNSNSNSTTIDDI